MLLKESIAAFYGLVAQAKAVLAVVNANDDVEASLEVALDTAYEFSAEGYTYGIAVVILDNKIGLQVFFGDEIFTKDLQGSSLELTLLDLSLDIKDACYEKKI